MTALVIGVSPGPRHTGIVLRSEETLRKHDLVARGDAPVEWYLDEVRDAIQQVRDTARNIVLQQAPNLLVASPAVLAIADPYSGFDHILDVAALVDQFDTAAVFGAVASHWVTLRVHTPPDPKPLSFYPARIQARGNERHLRAAWDIAGAAITDEQTEQTVG